MFRRLDNSAPGLIEISLDGEAMQVPAGISLAAALLYLDAIPVRRTKIGAAPRAPFCMMGICFECMVEIDGQGSQRACQREVFPGMQVSRRLDDGKPESGR
jgi:predicted molibdopterin-dependent oxidoreductase YjgC